MVGNELRYFRYTWLIRRTEGYINPVSNLLRKRVQVTAAQKESPYTDVQEGDWEEIGWDNDQTGEWDLGGWSGRP